VRLRSQRIVTPAGTVAGEVVLEDRSIASVRRRAGAPAGAGDAAWIVPGYIDVHVHGGGGAQCNTSDAEEVAAVAAFHARHGTTAMLATTVAAPVAELEASIRAIERAGVLGAHLEGPFISRSRPGAMDPDMFLDPDPAVLERLLAAGTVGMVTLAPELPGALAAVERLAGAGVVASLGHTDASYEQVRAACDAGARSVTHLFNAMRPFHHREPGAVGAALDLEALSCELICDGVHVDPVALRLALRAKGVSGLRLVTDAMEAAGLTDGSYRLGSASVAVSGGRALLAGTDTVAGSTLTMDAAVRGAVRLMGVTVEEAVAMASAAPARLLGLDGRKGAVAAGFDADLVLLDEELRVLRTMAGGGWV
jgi:N-acetylglucosamine-6-phosphate deacetylase